MRRSEAADLRVLLFELYILNLVYADRTSRQPACAGLSAECPRTAYFKIRSCLVAAYRLSGAGTIIITRDRGAGSTGNACSRHAHTIAGKLACIVHEHACTLCLCKGYFVCIREFA